MAQSFGDYFCDSDDRRALFYSDIATSNIFTFDKKIGLLSKILKRYPKLLADQQDTLIKDLREIQKFRNTLAHATLEFSLESAKDNGATFVSYKDGEKVATHVSAHDYETLRIKANMCNSEINSMRRLYPYREKTEEELAAEGL